MDLPTPAWNDDFLANADRYLTQVRGWGFNGVAGWSSTRTWARYNEAMREQGQPTIPYFRVINFHAPDMDFRDE